MSWQEVGARTSISLHPTSLDTCFSGVRAGLDLHSPVETCGSRGGGAAGSGGHCGEAVWRAEREGPTAMRLRPAAGERGGSQSPSTAVNYEGEEKIFKIYFCLGIFLPRRHTFFFFFCSSVCGSCYFCCWCWWWTTRMQLSRDRPGFCTPPSNNVFTRHPWGFPTSPHSKSKGDTKRHTNTAHCRHTV